MTRFLCKICNLTKSNPPYDTPATRWWKGRVCKSHQERDVPILEWSVPSSLDLSWGGFGRYATKPTGVFRWLVSVGARLSRRVGGVPRALVVSFLGVGAMVCAGVCHERREEFDVGRAS